MIFSIAFLAIALANQPQPRTSFEQLSAQAAQARDADHSEEAVNLYKQALKLRPDWKEGLWYLSTLLYQREHYAEAEEFLKHFVFYEPATGAGWALLGMTEYQTREYARSQNHLLHALSVGLGDDPLNRSVRYETATLLTRSEQYDDSLVLLMAMANTEPLSRPLVEAAGLAGLRLPLLPQEISPDRQEIVTLAGTAICDLGAHRRAEAESGMRKLVATYPNQPSVHFLLGALLMDKDHDAGVAEMQRELEISPGHVAARVRLAEEYLSRTKVDEALQLAEKAVALDPTIAGAHLILGRVLLSMNQAEKSLAELEKARDLSPATPGIHWALATAYSRAGRDADAARERAEVARLKEQKQ